MSTRSAVVRRLLWTVPAALALVGVLFWLLAPTSDDGTAGPEAVPDEPGVSSTPTPGSEPSSGPTGTPPPGSLEVVPVDEVTPLPAVPLTASADVGGGLTLRITEVDEVDGVAKGVGEIAGPALRFTLQLTNDSDAEVSVDSAVVDLLAGPGRVPAASLTGPGGRAFEGTVPPDSSVTGVYVFGVPEQVGERVRVSVSYQSGAPVAVFTGVVA